MKKAFFLIIPVVFLIIYACAPHRNTVFSNSYHNTTAHFNAYFIAREDIRAIEADILDKYEWNYNLILPVFPQFDSVMAQSYQSNIEHCIEKASLAIQFHKGSKWEDDAYVLVGEARFYSMDFVNAIETFKYVNTKGKDDNARHEALVDLMRTFIEYKELTNAQAVSDYLKNEDLNKENLKNLYLTRGYLYQKQENLNYMVQNLAQAEPMISNFKERARVNFIIGQVYQSLGFDGEAYKYYKTTLKNNPPYELSFYTKLNMAQVTQLAKNNDIKKVRKYFKHLLKDGKNEEFKDKIYYEMAKFEIRHGNLALGIEHYNSSIRASVSNQRQKAHSYWNLGKIYYDSLANYKMAKLYYDSTMSVLPQDELEYDAISARQVILSNFVEQLDIIHKNDSLLNMVALSEDSLDAYLNKYIAQEEEAENLRRKEEKKKQRQQATSGGFNPYFDDDSPLTLGANNYEGNVWYFYNTSALSRGKSTFQSTWGQRVREDNWRLNSKAPLEGSDGPKNIQSSKNKGESEPEEVEEEAEEFKIDKSELIASLPTTPESQQILLDEIEQASYKLGNIYNFDLEEKRNAVNTFETLLARFPETEYRHEVMYLLYLILNEMNLSLKADNYKNKILDEAPNSLYGKLLINPHYREDSRIESERLQKVYAKAYKLYEKGQYNDAMALANQGLTNYQDNDFVDNMELLKILISAKSGATSQYESELNNFIVTYSESELIPYVETLVTASEQHQLNLVNSSKAKFFANFNQPHFFVFLYQTDPQLAKELPAYFKGLLTTDSPLEVGNMILDKTYSLVLITEFESKEEAMAFNATVEAENTSEKINKSGKFYNFVISKQNFDVFYQTKEVDAYLNFYSKNY